MVYRSLRSEEVGQKKKYEKYRGAKQQQQEQQNVNTYGIWKDICDD